MGFFNILRRKYGEIGYNHILQMLDIKSEIIRLLNCKTFLIKCKKLGLLPKHILNQCKGFEFKNIHISQTFSRITRNWKEQMLKLEIKDACIRIRRLNQSFVKVRFTVKNLVSAQHLQEIFSLMKYRSFKLSSYLRSKFCNKLNILKQSQNTVNKEFLNFDHTKWIKNLTSMDIDQDVLKFLSLGPKFALPTTFNNLPIENYICDLEFAINNVDESCRDKLRKEFCSILHNAKQNRKVQNLDKLILRLHYKTHKFLRDNPNLIVTTSDKGNTTVIMHKQEYIDKNIEILSDTQTYQIISRDNTKSIQSSLNTLIQSWHNKKYINSTEKQFLQCHNGTIPKYYALPKIHKDGIPLRPIVSSRGSPFYNLCKHYHNILKHITGHRDSHIKNSFDFKNKINNVHIPVDYKIFSLDVKALFTNIPVDIVTHIIQEKWDQISQHTNIPLEQFQIGLRLIINNSNFTYNGNFYHQTYGMPMGAPLSPVIADLIMEHLEQECNKKIDFPILFFYRYVDDIILCVHHQNLSQLLNIYNSFHPRLQFTIEQESPNREISFLNLLLSVQDNHIRTNWYRKATYSGRVLNYHSSHSYNQKVAIVYNLIDSAIGLSDASYHSENVNIVHSILKNNSYPEWFIKKYINTRVQSMATPIQSTPTNTINSYVPLPSHHTINSHLKQLLHKYRLQPVFYNHHKSTHLFNKHKESTNTMNSSNVVYKIPCSSCSKVYIGETKQYLHKRLYQHRYDIKKDPSLHTSLTKHRTEHNHIIDFDNTTIVGFQKNLLKRLTLEMITILNNPAMNTKSDTNKLSSVYKYLIDKG